MGNESKRFPSLPYSERCAKDSKTPSSCVSIYPIILFQPFPFNVWHQARELLISRGRDFQKLEDAGMGGIESPVKISTTICRFLPTADCSFITI